MAPRAHVAAYKACWLEPGELRGTCSTADLTQAIEDAVADGVDIINYSVGSDDDIVDADDLALLAAVRRRRPRGRRSRQRGACTGVGGVAGRSAVGAGSGRLESARRALP
jgi:hypothetical protein